MSHSREFRKLAISQSDYVAEDNVKIYAAHSVVENDSKLAKLNALVADAKKIGCEKALLKHGHNVSYLLDKKRARYLDFLDIKKSDDVLEIGASMGQHTILIAKKCRSLEAIEVVPLQAKFARLWCDETGADNVRVTAGGANGVLPYEDGKFNLVILNYVLEWCAGRSQKSPEDFHRDFLTEIFRVLKPGGRLFLSTKNRFALQYVLGGVDEHMDERFGNALPRPIQAMLIKNKKMDKTFGFLHSRRKLESLLKEAGFRRSDRLIAFPDARYPEYLGYYDSAAAQNIRQTPRNAVSKLDRVVMRLPHAAQRELLRSHVYLAHKE